MTRMRREHKAVEKHDLEETLSRLPNTAIHARTLLARLSMIRPLTGDSVILDVGAAQGRFLVACAKLGYRAYGIEPWDEARKMAVRLAEHEGVSIRILAGVAEQMPFPSEEFDVVHSMSVFEHVQDVQMAFSEAYRVLKPGGVLWFYTASSICPVQREIRGFPLFGWYPDRLKRRIMFWARDNKPHLIGHTEMPAINWFTPWKARRMLRKAGFGRICDRWSLPRAEGQGRLVHLAFGLIGLCGLTRLCADVLKPGCAYAAVKEACTVERKDNTV